MFSKKNLIVSRSALVRLSKHKNTEKTNLQNKKTKCSITLSKDPRPIIRPLFLQSTRFTINLTKKIAP